MNEKTSPNHYADFDPEPIEITKQLPFREGNIVKYVCRAGKKEGESRLDDLLKAQWYLENLIEEINRDNKIELV